MDPIDRVDCAAREFQDLPDGMCPSAFPADSIPASEFRAGSDPSSISGKEIIRFGRTQTYSELTSDRAALRLL
jgi:hypothetical protein